MAALSFPVLIASIPPVTRAFTSATIAVTLLYAWLRWQFGLDYNPFIALIPGSSFLYPWTFFTSGLSETSIIEFIVTIIAVPPSLRYFERLWGTIETIKFILICIIIPNIIAVIFNWLEFAVTRNADLFLYGMQYRGQMALQMSILVAFTQLIPEHQVQIVGVIKARVKRLPMVYLTFSTIMTLIGFQCPFVVIQFGWLVSWMYLRFYKKNVGDIGGGDFYGDRNETFAFVNWFPPVVHYPISVLSDVTHSWATRFHIIPSSNPDMESGTYNQPPGSARAEAERRRAMALKALDNRMASSSPLSSQATISTQPQPPRPPPPAASPRSDGPAMPSSPSVSTRANERKKGSSVSELDVGDSINR